VELQRGDEGLKRPRSSVPSERWLAHPATRLVFLHPEFRLGRRQVCRAILKETQYGQGKACGTTALGEGERRKVTSNGVEAALHQHLVQHGLTNPSPLLRPFLCKSRSTTQADPPLPPVATAIAIGGCSAWCHAWLLLALEEGFHRDVAHVPPRTLSPSLSSCIRWLAQWHAAFLTDCQVSDVPTRRLSSLPVPAGVHARGTYWHLWTRQTDLLARSLLPADLATAVAVALALSPSDSALTDYPSLVRSPTLVGALADHAASLPATLSPRFVTLLHGDAKEDNFILRAASSGQADLTATAIDFQYTGLGVGPSDVLYLVSGTCENRAQIHKHLDYYFDCLAERLTSRTPQPEAAPSQSLAALVCAEWRALVPLVAADIVRFWDGWSGRSRRDKSIRALQTIDGVQERLAGKGVAL